MPVQGVIEYGSDTLMAYLLEPLARSLERRFKDG